jgi:hypothetical protein
VIRVSLRVARRFGLWLAGARTGRWRWLIAALVASLVSAPVAGAATRIGSTSAVGGSHRGRLARQATSQVELGARLALLILNHLSKSEAPARGGIGRVLEFASEAKPDPDIAGVKSQLGEIQTRLAALETEVGQLKEHVAQSHYSVLVDGTSKITAAIDRGFKDLNNVARTAPDDVGLKGFAAGTLDRIKKNLIDEPAQEELSKKFTGVAGSDGLIKAASKAVKARSPFWTVRSSKEVREVFNYWQAQETRLLALRVNYMNSHPLEFPRPVIEDAVKEIEQEVGTPAKPGVPAAAGTQEKLLKPSVPIDVFADTRDSLEWGYHDLQPHGVTYSEARQEVENYSGGWHLPSASEVQGSLLAGYPGYGSPGYQNWGTWLNDHLGGLLTDRKPFQVWLNSPRCSTTYDSCSYIGFNGKEAKTESDGVRSQVLVVRHRSETYWW